MSLVLLGASYLAAWPLAAIGDVPVINRAIPGNQTHEYIDRFACDVVDLEPQAVLIWGIDNDIIRSPRDRILETCALVEHNLEHLVKLARANGIEPILTTDLTLRPPARWVEGVASMVGTLRGKESYQAYVNGHVIRLNAFIRKLAWRENVHLLDLNPVVSGRDGMRARPFARPDGSHLSEAGYRAIEAYAVPRLEAWLHAPVGVRAARPSHAHAAIHP
jgi:lysophospholipase L1-like esterase